MPTRKVAIVGRPNVGKSSIFNWLAGSRIAIVDPTAGVTRDRVTFPDEWDGITLELVDTGGMGIEDRDGLTRDIEQQIEQAVEEAAVILFVVDAQTGMTELDRQVQRRLRKANKPILLVANKCDNDRLLHQASEFHSLGWEPLCVSVTANRNRPRLRSAILEQLPPAEDVAPVPITMKLAVVGKRNAGKSTFINELAHAERMIVSEVPGTTRDSVDVHFELHGKQFVAIDTAGVRRARSISDSVEFYGLARAQRSIRRADVVLLFLDPTTEIGKPDKQLAQYVVDQYKPCIFVVNKWDLMRPKPTSEFNEAIEAALPTLGFAPRVFITACSGKNVQGLVDLAQNLFAQSNARVSTGVLNRVLRAALERNPPPVRGQRRTKVFYAAQVSTAPPTVVLFCNAPRSLDPTYQRYLLGAMRDELPFCEIPIRLVLRQRPSHTQPKASARKEDGLLSEETLGGKADHE